MIASQFNTADCKLRREVRIAFEKLATDAAALGHSIKAISGYRTYEYQYSLYWRHYKEGNSKEAYMKSRDKDTARAGHSEHSLGLAVDVISLNNNLQDTPVYKWYSQNAHKYGFIVRYPKGSEPITGYIYEPWHLRYLGVDLATKVFESGLAYDEYCYQESLN